MTTHKGHVDTTDSMPRVIDAQVADAQVSEAPVSEAPASEAEVTEAEVTEAQAPAAALPSGPARTAASRLTALRAPRPAWQGLLAFAAYLAAFLVVYARPLIAHLNAPDLRQYWTDPNFYTWAMQWWPYAVTHGVNPLFSSQIGAPHGYDLAWTSTTPSVDLLMWPATAAFGVLVSYNLVLLLVPPLSAWACFLAARRLTGRFWPSLLAGAVYGYCPYELVHDWQGQPNLTVIALFPLMAYLVLRWRDRDLADGWLVVWLTLAMALEFYTFNEAFFDMTAVLAGGLVIGFLVAGRRDWRRVARLTGLTALAYAGSVILAAPYLYYALKHDPKTLARQNSEFSLHLARLVVPWTDKVFRVSGLMNYSYDIGRYGLDDYVGLPLLLVLLGLAVLAWRSRAARLLVAGFVLTVALGAGPYLVIGDKNAFRLPWSGLWSLPIARSAEPSRFVVFGLLALALALALWLAVPASPGKPVRGRLLLGARWALGLLAVASVLAVAPSARQAVNPVQPGYDQPATMHPVNQLPPFITDGLYRHYLSPGEIVVVVTHRSNAGMLFQADAHFYFRIAGGFINASLSPPNAIPHGIAVAADPSKNADRIFRKYLAISGVGAILVEQAWSEPWMSDLSTRYGLHGTAVGGVIVYPVAPWLASQARQAAGSPRAHQPHRSSRARHSTPAPSTQRA